MEIRTDEKKNRERVRKKNQRTMAETRWNKKKLNIPNLLTMFTKGERKYMQISKKAIILLSWFLHRKEFKKIFLSSIFFYILKKIHNFLLVKFVFFSNTSCLQEHFPTERKKKRKEKRSPYNDFYPSCVSLCFSTRKAEPVPTSSQVEC